MDPLMNRYRQQSAIMAMQRLRDAEMARRQAYAQAQMRQQALEQERAQRGALAGAQYQRALNNDDVRNRMLQEHLNLRRQEMADRAQREAAQDLARRRGTLKQGYRWKGPDSTEQELIPGGPEWNKLRAAHAGDLNKLQSVGSSTQELVKTIDYILDPKNKSGFTSNFGGWNAYITRMLPNIIPGYAHTSDVGSAIERLNELAEVSGLNTVRGNSGQSVGSITEREWPKFAAQLLKVSPRMEEDTARTFLKNARTTAMDIRNREAQAYKNEWEPTPFYQKNMDISQPPQAPTGGGNDSPAPAGVDPADWAVMSPQDKALWQTPAKP